MTRRSQIRLFRWGLFIGLLAPLAWFYWAWLNGRLGVFPEETLLHALGRLGLILLLATLALGPAFRLTGWRGFMAVRRQLGLWSFTYLLLHFLVWLGLDQGWYWSFIAAELRELRYLQVGLVSLLLLVPLVLTSVPRAQYLLGLRRWQWLHRLAYVSAAGGVLHFWLLARVERLEVWLAAVVLALLVVFRLGDAVWRHHQRP